MSAALGTEVEHHRELTKGEHNSPKSAPRPPASRKKQMHVSSCHADPVTCFHRTWDYHASSAVTG